MKINIELFHKINIQTSAFKQNVIKFFLYLKQKKNNTNNLDDQVKKEKINIQQLWQSSKEVTELQKKLESNNTLND